MLIEYDEFKNRLNAKLSDNIVLYYELLIKIIRYPYRFIGNFRVTNTKTKLIQYVTQSREILFGYFMEDIVYQYISLMDYNHMNRYIGQSSEDKPLNADQLFREGNTIYLIEQKVRDDHDSAKKRGQFNNFKEKLDLLSSQYPGSLVISVMWFIDNNFHKNKNYYIRSIDSLGNNNVHLKYGKELFQDIFNRVDVWDELHSYLIHYNEESSDEILNIPDLDTSDEVLEALQQLKDTEYSLYRKLTSSNAPQYVELRRKLFPTGTNFSRI